MSAEAEAAPWRLEDPTPRLNAALAAVQAELPRITKGETGEVRGTTEAGRPYSYDYDYAGLDAVSEAVIPLLGRNGLAFSAWPTMIDGKFVLLYELLHSSGEQKAGVFPLVASGKPQQLGGLITYYRRYALCAVTGVAPTGEDNDAADANHPQQYDSPRSAAEAFASASPMPRGRKPPAGQPGQPLTGQALKDHEALQPAFESRARGNVTRLPETPPDDQWLTVNGEGEKQPPGEVPPAIAEQAAHADQRQRNTVLGHFKRLGYEDHEREERLVITGQLAGGIEVSSTSDLTQDQARMVASMLSRFRDRPALTAMLVKADREEHPQEVAT